MTAVPIDIDVDWNTMDDTGLPWTFVDEAVDPSKIVAGAFVIAGRGTAVAVAEVVDVDEDGVVHLCDVEGGRGQPSPGSAGEAGAVRICP